MWVLLVFAIPGIALSAWLIGYSSLPEPGARMVLMGLPCFALPLLPMGLALSALATFGNKRLATWERCIAAVVGLLAVTPMFCLVLLGH